MNIGNNLQSSQEEKLITLLQKYSKYFSWDYKDMPGIHPKTCIHHIYTDNEIKPIKKQQIRMNPMMKEIVKEEL